MVNHKAHELIFKEGAIATKLYIVKSGEVLCLKSANDRLIPVFKAEAGDIVGESALAGENHTYSAITLTDVELLEVSSESLQEVLKTAPAWLTQLSTTMVSRFQDTAQLVAENRVFNARIISEDKFPASLEIEFKNLIQ